MSSFRADGPDLLIHPKLQLGVCAPEQFGTVLTVSDPNDLATHDGNR